jgi:hypothetical protein
MKNFYVLYNRYDDEYLVHFDNAEKIKYEVSKLIVFSDCIDGEIKQIVIDGREVRYAGWQPDMIVELLFSDTNETCHIGQYLSWEH